MTRYYAEPDYNESIIGNLYHPDSDVISKKFQLSSGDKGIRQTLKRMKKLALKGAESAPIWDLSRRLVGDYQCDVHDQACEADTLLEWVQDHIRWTPDIGTAETIAAPWRTLEVRAGDCDDVSTLLASLAVSISIPVRFKAIAADPSSKNEFTHVYVEFLINDEWTPAEPSIQGKPLGWETDDIYKTMYEEVWVD